MARRRIVRALAAIGGMAGLLAIGGLDPAEARDLTGSLAYRERIALPPDAALLVEASDGLGRVVAAVRQPTDGAQVPLGFALAVPEGQDLLLRGGLSVDGEIRWLSEPVHVAAGADDADLGLVPLVPYRAMGFSSRLRCGELAAEVGFRGEGAILRVGPRQIALAPAVAASGAKFADPADEGTWVWSKGDAVSISLGGTALPECVTALPADEGWRANGHEPEWTITVQGGQLTYAPLGAEARDVALPAPEPSGFGALFRLDPIGLAVTVTPEVCRDTMTGMPRPDRVAVAEGTRILTGCGGEPAALLAGPEWRILDLAGAPLPEGAEATLLFSSGGGLSGRAACNRFTGRYTLSGEGLRLEPGGMTMMACPEPVMAAERAVLDALAKADRFDFDAAGDLLLIGGDGVLIRARF